MKIQFDLTQYVIVSGPGVLRMVSMIKSIREAFGERDADGHCTLGLKDAKWACDVLKDHHVATGEVKFVLDTDDHESLKVILDYPKFHKGELSWFKPVYSDTTEDLLRNTINELLSSNDFEAAIGVIRVLKKVMK